MFPEKKRGKGLNNAPGHGEYGNENRDHGHNIRPKNQEIEA